MQSIFFGKIRTIPLVKFSSISCIVCFLGFFWFVFSTSWFGVFHVKGLLEIFLIDPQLSISTGKWGTTEPTGSCLWLCGAFPGLPQTLTGRSQPLHLESPSAGRHSLVLNESVGPERSTVDFLVRFTPEIETLVRFAHVLGAKLKGSYSFALKYRAFPLISLL